MFSQRGVNLYSFEKLFDQLSEELKKTLPLSVWCVISEYWLKEFKQLRDPVSGGYFTDPVIINHPLIAPIVYERKSVYNAVISRELIDFDLALDQIQSVPFVKAVADYLTDSMHVPLQYSQEELKEIQVDAVDEKAMSLPTPQTFLRMLEDPILIVQNNFAAEMKRLMQRQKKAGMEFFDLGKLANEFDWPIVHNGMRFVRPDKKITATPNLANACVGGLVCMIAISLCDAFVMGIPLSSAIQRTNNNSYNGSYVALPFFFANQARILGQLLGFHKVKYPPRHRVSPKIHLAIFSVYSYLASYFRNFDFDYSERTMGIKVLFQISLLSHAYFESVITTSVFASFIKFLSSHESRLIRPLPSRSILPLLFFGISTANLTYSLYYANKFAETKGDWAQKWMLASMITYPLSVLPKFVMTSRQTAFECQTFVKSVVRNPYRLFRPSRDTEGFEPTQQKDYLGHFGVRFARVGAAVFAGVFAFILSEDPIFALVAALAMFNESSLANLMNMSNNRYRLLSSPIKDLVHDEKRIEAKRI